MVEAGVTKPSEAASSTTIEQAVQHILVRLYRGIEKIDDQRRRKFGMMIESQIDPRITPNLDHSVPKVIKLRRS